MLSSFPTISDEFAAWGGGGGGVLPIMAYMGRLCPKEVPFTGFRYMKGKGFHKLRYIKGYGKQSFRYLKEPLTNNISNRRSLWLYQFIY